MNIAVHDYGSIPVGDFDSYGVLHVVKETQIKMKSISDYLKHKEIK